MVSKNNYQIIKMIKYKMIILQRNVLLKVLLIHRRIYLHLFLDSRVVKDILRQINRQKFCKEINNNKIDRLFVLGYNVIRLSKQTQCFFHLDYLKIIQFWLTAKIKQEIGKFIVRIILY